MNPQLTQAASIQNVKRPAWVNHAASSFHRDSSQRDLLFYPFQRLSQKLVAVRESPFSVVSRQTHLLFGQILERMIAWVTYFISSEGYLPRSLMSHSRTVLSADAEAKK